MLPDGTKKLQNTANHAGSTIGGKKANAAILPASSSPGAQVIAPAPSSNISITSSTTKDTKINNSISNSSNSYSLLTSNNNNEIDDFLKTGPPKQMSASALSKLAPEEKRRYDRNLREQQRSYKISQQIKELRTVLSESSVPFKPNKFSILMSVVGYIKDLQSRAMFLDSEHQKLIHTISQTSEMVSSGHCPPDTTTSGFDPGSNKQNTDANASSAPSNIGNDSNMLLVQGLDYQNIFKQCSAALGVAALDGRFIDCNPEFELVSGYSREELTRPGESLFNLLTNSDMEEVFSVMGQMLKESTGVDGGGGGNGDGENAATESVGSESNGNTDGGGSMNTDAANEDGSKSKPKTYWSGVVRSQRHQNISLLMNITLARSPDGMPKFFNCALTSTG